MIWDQDKILVGKDMHLMMHEGGNNVNNSNEISKNLSGRHQ